MTRMPTDVKTYMDTALRSISMIDERQALVDWWKEQKPFHDHLGLSCDSRDWRILREAWTKRGQTIVINGSSTTIDRRRVG